MLHKHPTATAPALPDVTAATEHFATWTKTWHTDPVVPAAPGSVLQELHRANYELWHLEDEARDPAATDSAVAHVKRGIDKTNQRRNDLVERFDGDLLHRLATCGLPAADAPLHSETPGMMFDRLSILALKQYHTAEEANRASATPEHRQRNRERLAVLQQQSSDLATCLHQLLQAVLQGTRGYRLYRQLKMYNDPELNPVLYRGQTAGTAMPQP